MKKSFAPRKTLNAILECCSLFNVKILIKVPCSIHVNFLESPHDLQPVLMLSGALLWFLAEQFRWTFCFCFFLMNVCDLKFSITQLITRLPIHDLCFKLY